MEGSSRIYSRLQRFIRSVKGLFLSLLLAPWFWISQKKKSSPHRGWQPSPIHLNVFLIEAKERRRGLRFMERDQWINGLVSDIEAYLEKRSEDIQKREE
jgi:hypothetical protein